MLRARGETVKLNGGDIVATVDRNVGGGDYIVTYTKDGEKRRVVKNERDFFVDTPVPSGTPTTKSAEGSEKGSSE
jgi:hypothetical protein